MALFAIWRESECGEAERLHAALLAEAHIVPEHITATRLETQTGAWQVCAFACASHFYRDDAQLWLDPAGGACVTHGLVWRIGEAGGALLDAEAIGALLDRPGATLPSDILGEYAIGRLYPDGSFEAFADPAGLQQIFFSGPVVSNRAGFVALLCGDRKPDPTASLWLGAMGYRFGSDSSWSGVAQLPQGGHLRGRPDALLVEQSRLRLPDRRGFEYGGPRSLARGIEQAKAAILLAAGNEPLDLPITGGKDSRAVLAIALAAGLRDRLTLFTRGYADHPDVVVGALIADRIGVAHRREPPLGSDMPADLQPRDFLRLLATIAWQSDGGMGGYDDISARTTGTQMIVSGHLGEVLKAYAKRASTGPLDPIAMICQQAPFDPLGVLREPAHARLAQQVAQLMDMSRAAGAAEDDLPDLFYWHNRVPNWLGGIRAIKSFERQPILPLGVPALMELAWQMTAAERKAELAHYRLIEATAPELLDLPFAHQSWHASLCARLVSPVLAPAALPLFGSWQWSVNRVPGVRAALAELFAGVDIPLWDDVDRAVLIAALHQRRFDGLDLISLLGFAAAAIHQAELGLPQKLNGRTIGEAAIDRFAAIPIPRVVGHFDGVTGAARIEDDMLVIEDEGVVTVMGWLHAPDWPGATVPVEARIDGTPAGAATADRHRIDLQQAGIGDGRHAFMIEIDAARFAGATSLQLVSPGSETGPTGGALAIRARSAGRSTTMSA